MKPLKWIPTLYFFQGCPYTVVALVSVIFFKNFGFANDKIALVTSLLVLPWSLKPLVAPYLEDLATKKTLTLLSQFLLAACTALLALSLENLSTLFWSATVLFGTIAILSSIHDITSDGIYLTALSTDKQALYVGVRTFFYQMARLCSEGLFIVLVGLCMAVMSVTHAWQLMFLMLASLLFLLAIYHIKSLPIETRNCSTMPGSTTASRPFKGLYLSQLKVFKAFLNLPQLPTVIAFLLFYSFPSFQLTKVLPLFLLDKQQGLALSTTTVGFIYGSFGIGFLMLGAIIAGGLIARYRLQRVLMPTTLLMLLSNALLWRLSVSIHPNLWQVTFYVVFNQFVFGLCSSVYMTYLLQMVSSEDHAMSLYALGTALMALGILLAGSVSSLFLTYFNFQQIFRIITLISLLITIITYMTLGRQRGTS
jgi:MFS transporter, PAT family, beta-lactamase induction signal transducer AmpG